jgi:hypothetical protein
MPSIRSKTHSPVGTETFLFPACPAERVGITKSGHGIMIKLLYTKRRNGATRRASNYRKLRADMNATASREASGVTTMYANSKRAVYTHVPAAQKVSSPLFIMTAPSVVCVPSNSRERIAIFKEFPYAVISEDKCLPHVIVDSLLAPDTACKLLRTDTSPVMMDFSSHADIGTAEKPAIIVVVHEGMVRRAWQYKLATGTCVVRQIVVYSSSQPHGYESIEPQLTIE